MKKENNLSVASLFSVVRSLDLCFHSAGFEIDYTNDFDKDAWKTFARKN